MDNDKFFNDIIDYIENMPMEEFEHLVGQLDNLPCPFAVEDELNSRKEDVHVL